MKKSPGPGPSESEKIRQEAFQEGLNRFSAQLAHDVTSFVALVRAQKFDDPRLERQIAYMEKMVRKMRLFSAPEPLRTRPIRINSLLEMTLDMFSVPENVEVIREFSDNLPEIEGDRKQLQQAFVEILENACQSIADAQGMGGNCIRIRTGFDGREIKIAILDEGLGVPEEFRGRLFDPFFTTRKTQGSPGFGLAIARQIIRAHGGEVVVEESDEASTAVVVRVPVTENPNTDDE
ncbi:MAG TPA: ATP-binding protein [Calditrichia bacterium]|nr:hypothetical protein [Calditrichota bacterium]HQV32260.1 ATP-binding protein [Calditrichia bacterium]